MAGVARPASLLLRTPALAALLALAIVIGFHSPAWWLLVHPVPGSVQWSRAADYLLQCQAPFRLDVEPALRWRFVPQVLVWAFGGSPRAGLIIPWIGAWALLAYLLTLARQRGATPLTGFYAALALGATAPLLVSTGWLGFNDAWVALGLCYLAFGRRGALVALVCVICPFIDERFVFGVPEAVVLRLLAGDDFFPKLARLLPLALAPFAVGRAVGGLLGRGLHGDFRFYADSILASRSYLWVAPLGIWMALRFAYFPAAQELVALGRRNAAAAAVLAAACFLPVAVGVLLAADVSRTAGILLPLCVWAVMARIGRDESPRYWAWLALANLLVPAAHVTFTRIMPINSLPVEFWRLLR